MGQLPKLYLVTSVYDDIEEFIGVFSSYKKALRHIEEKEFAKYPMYDFKSEETITKEMTKITMTQSHKPEGPKIHYYIQVLKIDETY